MLRVNLYWISCASEIGIEGWLVVVTGTRERCGSMIGKDLDRDRMVTVRVCCSRPSTARLA